MPTDTEWLPMDRFTDPLDADGCSADVWIKKGSVEVLAFYCNRSFDGMPPGWFDRYGDPVDFTPEFFRRPED